MAVSNRETHPLVKDRSGPKQWVSRQVSVIIPARNEAGSIGATVAAVKRQAWPGLNLDILVVNDGSTDHTAEMASLAGARTLTIDNSGAGNPAAARNRGVAATTGDPVVFLDADCIPGEGWLRALLAAHEAGETIVGGSLDLPPGLRPMARCDYYCGWYLIHSKRHAGYVPHHPPPNLSVRRGAFLTTAGFTEAEPFSYTNEERSWQAQLQKKGYKIYFEPRAMAFHYNRPGLLNLLRRNYRWAYTAIEAKSQTGAARLAWLYDRPRLLIAASAPLAFAHTGFVIYCWLRAGVYEPVLMLPPILLSRFAYAAGMMVGGLQWLRRQRRKETTKGPRWI